MKSKLTAIMLYEQQDRKLDELASQSGASRSELVRRMIDTIELEAGLAFKVGEGDNSQAKRPKIQTSRNGEDGNALVVEAESAAV